LGSSFSFKLRVFEENSPFCSLNITCTCFVYRVTDVDGDPPVKSPLSVKVGGGGGGLVGGMGLGKWVVRMWRWSGGPMLSYVVGQVLGGWSQQV